MLVLLQEPERYAEIMVVFYEASSVVKLLLPTAVVWFLSLPVKEGPLDEPVLATMLVLLPVAL